MGFLPTRRRWSHEAQRRGIEVLPPDVNRSGVECSVERPSGPREGVEGLGLSVRVGLGYITGLKAEEALALVEERRRGGSYTDLADLASRSAAGADGARAARLGREPANGSAVATICGAARTCGGSASPEVRDEASRPNSPSPSRFQPPPPCSSWIRGSAWSPTTRPREWRSPSTRCRCCGLASATR